MKRNTRIIHTLVGGKKVYFCQGSDMHNVATESVYKMKLCWAHKNTVFAFSVGFVVRKMQVFNLQKNPFARSRQRS